MNEGKNEKLKKEGKIEISILISIYTVHFVFLKVYTKFENNGSNRSREICDRNFHWREKNEQIKGLISSMCLFFVTQYNSSLSRFVLNFRILTQVDAEKSLTKKKFTDRQTDRQTDKHSYRKAKTIQVYPIYNSYRGIKIEKAQPVPILTTEWTL